MCNKNKIKIICSLCQIPKQCWVGSRETHKTSQIWPRRWVHLRWIQPIFIRTRYNFWTLTSQKSWTESSVWNIQQISPWIHRSNYYWCGSTITHMGGDSHNSLLSAKYISICHFKMNAPFKLWHKYSPGSHSNSINFLWDICCAASPLPKSEKLTNQSPKSKVFIVVG